MNDEPANFQYLKARRVKKVTQLKDKNVHFLRHFTSFHKIFDSRDTARD